MLKGRATAADMDIAALLLTVFLVSFPFQVLNRIMMSVFYAKNDIMFPMYVVIGTTLLGTLFSYVFIGHMGIYVMAIASLLRNVLKSLILGGALAYKHSIQWPLYRLASFLKNLLLQFFVGVCIFKFLYATLCGLVVKCAFSGFFSEGNGGYWILVLGSFCITLGILWRIQRSFGIKLYLVPQYED
jgi:peptidoglycan biosynthesis protein MviN/MurJ (putative lipid II flippase)